MSFAPIFFPLPPLRYGRGGGLSAEQMAEADHELAFLLLAFLALFSSL